MRVGVQLPEVERVVRRDELAAMDSIRSPMEPTIRGGPFGRGPRGKSAESRAW